MDGNTVFRLIDTGAGAAGWNMAVDEALLTLAAQGKTGPTLRFFSWERPSFSIGSFQKTGELDMDALRAHNIPLVRRPTGGRAVLHDAELTYSVVCPIPSGHFPSDLMGSYRAIGACFLAGLRLLGVEAALVPVSRSPDRKKGKNPVKDPLCFSSPSWYEVLAGGRKLIGSAQRRVRDAFLQQGSLLVRPDIPALTALFRYEDEAARNTAVSALTAKMTALSEHIPEPGMSDIKDAVARGFEAELGIALVPGDLTPEELSLAVRLDREKYSTEGWNMLRSADSVIFK